MAAARREHLKEIRHQFRRLLSTGEFQQRAAALPRYRTRSGIRPPDVAEYATVMLGEAAVLAGADAEEKASGWWRKRAEYVAAELERLAAWMNV